MANCFQGYNSCVFAYGQTGSGKTHTMLGGLAADTSLCEQSGLMPRMFDHLLSEMHRRSADAEAGSTVKFHLDLSMLEIYNETLMDLLHPEASNLAIREDHVQGVHVEGVSRRRVQTCAHPL